MTEKEVPAALQRLVPDGRLEAGLNRILAEIDTQTRSMTRSQLVARLLEHRDNDVRVYIPRDGDRGAYILPIGGVTYEPDRDVICIDTGVLVEEDPDPESPYERGVREGRRQATESARELTRRWWWPDLADARQDFERLVGPWEPAEQADGDPWRMAEWHALPEQCFIDGCTSSDIDQRGPVNIRGGLIRKACVDHWEPIFRVLGEQAGWERIDAMTVAAEQSAPSCTCPMIDVTNVRADGGEGIRTFVRGLDPACPTCSGPIRETVGMVCQTCSTDYAPAEQAEPVTDAQYADQFERIAASEAVILADELAEDDAHMAAMEERHQHEAEQDGDGR